MLHSGAQLAVASRPAVKECQQVIDSPRLSELSTPLVDNFVRNLPKAALTA